MTLSVASVTRCRGYNLLSRVDHGKGLGPLHGSAYILMTLGVLKLLKGLKDLSNRFPPTNSLCNEVWKNRTMVHGRG